jgi:N-dimethylarginine dimethylaminohydrolase
MRETPSQLSLPSYLMNFPFSLSTADPNNVWMKELNSEQLKINKPRAYRQFTDLYNYMAGGALVYLLPTEGNFQDLVYTANMGIYLPHIKDENHIILSNFTSPPRQGEELVGDKFLTQMGYKTHFSPFKWEGEADLKYLKDNVYIGGYGIRSQYEAYDWMEETFDMKIIQLEMVDEYLYHLDCSIFPLSKDKTLVCTEMFAPEEIADIERYTQIIDVNIDDAMGGITNSVRMGNTILCASNIVELKRTDEDYDYEKQKILSLEKICAHEGMEPVIFNLSEFTKSGALLSCLVMKLNYIDQNKSLI